MSADAPAPKITRKSRFPVVWLVPVLALVIGGWMVFRELQRRGSEISIHFPNAPGVEAGKTALVHKGVVVGSVQDVFLEKDLSGVVVKLRLDKDAEAFAHAGSQFWIVRPEVTFSGVRGLETLIAGVQIHGRPGRGPAAKEFTGIERQPATEDRELGRAFVLRASKLGSLSNGAPVYYRELKVGAVETSRLADDATAVLVRIRIYSPYVDLVRINSQFWNAGGAAFKVNLLGAELKSTSLQALFSGGVAFATPDKDGVAAVAEDGAQFTLHDEMEKDWLKWEPRIPIKALDSEPVAQPRPTDVGAALNKRP
jgi:paraquat-inducible protein B